MKKSKKIFFLVVLIILIIAIVTIFLIVKNLPHDLSNGLPVDLRGGEWCGQTASGFGTCGYMGPVKDCDCDGEKYEWWNGITDIGNIIKCDGKASNFRDVPLPNDVCKGDPERRCELLGGEACKESAINKTLLQNFPKKGSDNASITITMFGDFSDPYTYKFFNETFPLLKKEYIDTGLIIFYWIDHPIIDSYNQGDMTTRNAAEAGKCAQEQGKFGEMQNKLLTDQRRINLSTSNYYQYYLLNFNKENFIVWAKEIGLNENKFRLCLESGKYKSFIQSEQNLSDEYAIIGTPTFFVNYKELVGLRSYEEFKAEMDKQLKEFA